VVILSNGFESNSTTILFTGSIYSPSISKTTTHYVRTSTGPDLVSGCQWLLQFILPHHWWVCLFRLRMPYVKGSTYIYCKWWWFIWIFNWWDYKAANVRKQRVSNYYVEKGQIVSVRTRYAVNLTENKRPMEKVLLKIICPLLYLRMHLTDMLIPLKLEPKTS
jgi:hypothetical protein